MKKIMTLLASALTLGFGAYAQRLCDIRTVLVSPSNNATVNCNDSFLMHYLFINEGPDPILAGDTLIAQEPEAANGEAVWVYGITNTIAVGDTFVGYNSNSHIGLTNFLLDDQFELVEPPYVAGTTYGYPVLFIGFTADTSVLKDPNPANDLDIATINYTCPTSIFDKNLTKQSLAVYPNPVKSQLSFDFTTTNTAAPVAKISDITGRTIFVKDFGKIAAGNNKYQIDVNNLTNGIYFVEFIVEDKKSVSKFVINR